MIFFNNFIPLLGSFLSGFSLFPYLLCFGLVLAVPSIIKEVVSYV